MFKKFDVPLIVLPLIIAAIILSVVTWQATKEVPPQPTAAVGTVVIVTAASPPATSTPALLEGMDAINAAVSAGRCPDPDKIPGFLDVRDPADPTGQKFCPKSTGAP